MQLDQETLIWFGTLVAAVILHEVSHGVVARWFGDRTAADAGRLTLNPVPHIDPLGSIVLPMLGAIFAQPVVAWAKPVPVNPSQMRHPRRAMFVVSLAGPVTNLLLMLVSALAARALFDPTSVRPGFGLSGLPLAIQILYVFALVNLFLAIFNLLPIPPLDGSAIFELFMPREWLPRWYRFRPYGLLVIFALVFTVGIDKYLAPFQDWLVRFIFR